MIGHFLQRPVSTVKSFQGVDIATTLQDLLNPAQLALVVYDMQVGIRSQIADGDRVVSAVGKVLEAARGAGVRTIFTRHMSLPVQLMGAMAFRTAMAWQHTDDPAKVSPWFLRDTPGFALVPAVYRGGCSTSQTCSRAPPLRMDSTRDSIAATAYS